jgi:hypothetical protein
MSKIVLWSVHGVNWLHDEIIGCLISDHCFRAAKHDFAVWYWALKQHCQYQCEMCQPEFCVLQSHQGQGCWLALSLPFDQHSDPCASIAWSVWKDMLVAKVAITASAQVWNMPAWGSSWCPLPVTRATGRGQWSSDSAWLLWLTCVAPVILTVQNQRRIIIRTFNVKADEQWPFQTCLGSEVLNQLLFPFTERIFQFFYKKSAWMVSRNFQHANLVSVCYDLPWMQELFWLPTSESEGSWEHLLPVHLHSPDDILPTNLRLFDWCMACSIVFTNRKVYLSACESW